MKLECDGKGDPTDSRLKRLERKVISGMEEGVGVIEEPRYLAPFKIGSGGLRRPDWDQNERRGRRMDNHNEMYRHWWWRGRQE